MDPKDTAAYFSLAELMVIQGWVGLAIVYGFVYGLPLVTTQQHFHSPEIEYLTPKNEQTYSDAILNLLNFPTKLASKCEAAEEQENHLHLDRSAERFLHAIVCFSTSQLLKGTSRSTVRNY